MSANDINWSTYDDESKVQVYYNPRYDQKISSTGDIWTPRYYYNAEKEYEIDNGNGRQKRELSLYDKLMEMGGWKLFDDPEKEVKKFVKKDKGGRKEIC